MHLSRSSFVITLEFTMHLATDVTAQPPADLSTAYLHQVALILVSQAINLLRETVTTDEQLTFTSELIPGSTIGKHLRSALIPIAQGGKADGLRRTQTYS